jgi:hypothetical protein
MVSVLSGFPLRAEIGMGSVLVAEKEAKDFML